jgi:hypothetical protein
MPRSMLAVARMHTIKPTSSDLLASGGSDDLAIASDRLCIRL